MTTGNLPKPAAHKELRAECRAAVRRQSAPPCTGRDLPALSLPGEYPRIHFRFFLKQYPPSRRGLCSPRRGPYLRNRTSGGRVTVCPGFLRTPEWRKNPSCLVQVPHRFPCLLSTSPQIVFRSAPGLCIFCIHGWASSAGAFGADAASAVKNQRHYCRGVALLLRVPIRFLRGAVSGPRMKRVLGQDTLLK